MVLPVSCSPHGWEHRNIWVPWFLLGDRAMLSSLYWTEIGSTFACSCWALSEAWVPSSHTLQFQWGHQFWNWRPQRFAFPLLFCCFWTSPSLLRISDPPQHLAIGPRREAPRAHGMLIQNAPDWLRSEQSDPDIAKKDAQQAYRKLGLKEAHPKPVTVRMYFLCFRTYMWLTSFKVSSIICGCEKSSLAKK